MYLKFYADKQPEYTNKLFTFKIITLQDVINILVKFYKNKNQIKTVFITDNDKTNKKLDINKLHQLCLEYYDNKKEELFFDNILVFKKLSQTGEYILQSIEKTVFDMPKFVQSHIKQYDSL